MTSSFDFDERVEELTYEIMAARGWPYRYKSAARAIALTIAVEESEERHFVFVDVETTGKDPTKDVLIEIGARRISSQTGEVLDTFTKLVDPGRQISKEIRELTNITQEELEGAIDPQTAKEQFIRFLGADLAVAHNYPFERAFLDLGPEGIDTLEMHRALLPGEPAALENYLRKTKNLPQAHRALADVDVTIDLHEDLMRAARGIPVSATQAQLEQSMRAWGMRYGYTSEEVRARIGQAMATGELSQTASIGRQVKWLEETIGGGGIEEIARHFGRPPHMIRYLPEHLRALYEGAIEVSQLPHDKWGEPIVPSGYFMRSPSAAHAYNIRKSLFEHSILGVAPGDRRYFPVMSDDPDIAGVKASKYIRRLGAHPAVPLGDPTTGEQSGRPLDPERLAATPAGGFMSEYLRMYRGVILVGGEPTPGGMWLNPSVGRPILREFQTISASAVAGAEGPLPERGMRFSAGVPWSLMRGLTPYAADKYGRIVEDVQKLESGDLYVTLLKTTNSLGAANIRAAVTPFKTQTQQRNIEITAAGGAPLFGEEPVEFVAGMKKGDWQGLVAMFYMGMNREEIYKELQTLSPSERERLGISDRPESIAHALGGLMETFYRNRLPDMLQPVWMTKELTESRLRMYEEAGTLVTAEGFGPEQISPGIWKARIETQGLAIPGIAMLFSELYNQKNVFYSWEELENLRRGNEPEYNRLMAETKDQRRQYASVFNAYGVTEGFLRPPQHAVGLHQIPELEEWVKSSGLAEGRSPAAVHKFFQSLVGSKYAADYTYVESPGGRRVYAPPAQYMERMGARPEGGLATEQVSAWLGAYAGMAANLSDPDALTKYVGRYGLSLKSIMSLREEDDPGGGSSVLRGVEGARVPGSSGGIGRISEALEPWEVYAPGYEVGEIIRPIRAPSTGADMHQMYAINIGFAEAFRRGIISQHELTMAEEYVNAIGGDVDGDNFGLVALLIKNREIVFKNGVFYDKDGKVLQDGIALLNAARKRIGQGAGNIRLDVAGLNQYDEKGNIIFGPMTRDTAMKDIDKMRGMAPGMTEEEIQEMIKRGTNLYGRIGRVYQPYRRMRGTIGEENLDLVDELQPRAFGVAQRPEPLGPGPREMAEVLSWSMWTERGDFSTHTWSHQEGKAKYLGHGGLRGLRSAFLNALFAYEENKITGAKELTPENIARLMAYDESQIPQFTEAARRYKQAPAGSDEQMRAKIDFLDMLGDPRRWAVEAPGGRATSPQFVRRGLEKGMPTFDIRPFAHQRREEQALSKVELPPSSPEEPLELRPSSLGKDIPGLALTYLDKDWGKDFPSVKRGDAFETEVLNTLRRKYPNRGYFSHQKEVQLPTPVMQLPGGHYFRSSGSADIMSGDGEELFEVKSSEISARKADKQIIAYALAIANSKGIPVSRVNARIISPNSEERQMIEGGRLREAAESVVNRIESLPRIDLSPNAIDEWGQEIENTLKRNVLAREFFYSRLEPLVIGAKEFVYAIKTAASEWRKWLPRITGDNIEGFSNEQWAEMKRLIEAQQEITETTGHRGIQEESAERIATVLRRRGAEIFPTDPESVEKGFRRWNERMLLGLIPYGRYGAGRYDPRPSVSRAGGAGQGDAEARMEEDRDLIRKKMASEIEGTEAMKELTKHFQGFRLDEQRRKGISEWEAESTGKMWDKFGAPLREKLEGVGSGAEVLTKEMYKTADAFIKLVRNIEQMSKTDYEAMGASSELNVLANRLKGAIPDKEFMQNLQTARETAKLAQLAGMDVSALGGDQGGEAQGPGLISRVGSAGARLIRGAFSGWEMMRLQRIWGMTGGAAMGAIPEAMARESAATTVATAGMAPIDVAPSPMVAGMTDIQNRVGQLRANMGRAAYQAYGPVLDALATPGVGGALGVGLPAIGVGAIAGTIGGLIAPQLAVPLAIAAGATSFFTGQSNRYWEQQGDESDRLLSWANTYGTGRTSWRDFDPNNVDQLQPSFSSGPQAPGESFAAPGYDPLAQLTGAERMKALRMQAGDLYGLSPELRSATIKNQLDQMTLPKGFEREKVEQLLAEYGEYKPITNAGDVIGTSLFQGMYRAGTSPSAYRNIASELGIPTSQWESIAQTAISMPRGQFESGVNRAQQYSFMARSGAMKPQELLDAALGRAQAPMGDMMAESMGMLTSGGAMYPMQLPEMDPFQEAVVSGFVSGDPYITSRAAQAGVAGKMFQDWFGRSAPNAIFNQIEAGTGLRVGTTDTTALRAGLESIGMGGVLPAQMQDLGGPAGGPGRFMTSTGDIAATQWDLTSQWGIQDRITAENRSYRRAQFGMQRKALQQQKEFLFGGMLAVGETVSTDQVDQMMMGATMQEAGIGMPGMFELQGQMRAENYRHAMASSGIQAAQIAMGSRHFTERQALQREITGEQQEWKLADIMKSFDRNVVKLNDSMSDLNRNFGRQMTGFGWESRQLERSVQMGRADFAWQREGLEISHARAQTQFGWATEDLQFRQGMSQLTFGWQQEDLSEAIRFSTGRDRQRLERQRERGAIMFGAEQGQMDEEMSRLEERRKWENEDHQRQLEHLNEQEQKQEEIWQDSREQLEQRKRWAEEDFATGQERLERQRQWLEEDHTEALSRHEQQVEWSERQFDMDARHNAERTSMAMAAHAENVKHMTIMKDIEEKMAKLQEENVKKQLANQQTQLDMAEDHEAALDGIAEEQKGITRGMELMSSAMRQLMVIWDPNTPEGQLFVNWVNRLHEVMVALRVMQEMLPPGWNGPLP